MVLAITSLLAGCSAIDPYPDDAYYKNIYVINPYAIHTDTLTLGGIDYTSANISAGGSGNVTSITAGTGITLTPNPIISSGTVAIDNTVVTLTGAQSLTNKQLLMNNGDAIQWNTFAGVSQDTLNLLASNILQLTNPSGAVQILGGSINLNYNIDEEIYLWGGTKGTGRNLVLYSGYATALDTLRDSPTLDMAASYWDGGAAVGWETTFEDYMIDAAPHSRLVVSTNDTAIIGFDNDVGIPSTILFGDLDANSFSIKDTDLVDILQIGVEPSSTLDKAGIYA